MARQKRRKDWTACAHCGQPGERFTRDHIPPKGLCHDKRNLVLVPSCDRCNRGAARDEEYFRAMLLPHHRVLEHPEAKKVLPTLFESLERPDHRGFAKSIARGIKMEDIFTPMGLWIGQRPVYHPNEKRMSRVVRKIVRGLYYNHFGMQPLSGEWGVWVCWQHHFPVAKAQRSHAKIVQALQVELPRILGNGVLTYSFAQASDVPEATVWLMKFYGAVEFICATMPKSQSSTVE